MDRAKKISRTQGRCLICAALIIISFYASAAVSPYKVGEITQAEGEITYLDFTPPHKITEVKAKTQALTDGSYLTHDSAFMTVKLFDGSWLRLSPRSKLSFDYDAQQKFLFIRLMTGSIKVLFSDSLEEKSQKIEKLIVASSDGNFEAANAKFTVVRNTLTDTSSVYVEKGTVVAVTDNGNTSLIHGGETANVKFGQDQIETPRNMTEKELKFLQPSSYLKPSHPLGQ